MSRIKLRVLLPILCSIAMLFSVVGTIMASGAVNNSSDVEALSVDDILERDGYLEGIWYPWFQHSYLGHCLTGNELFANTLNSDSWNKVGIDQYGEISIYREIYNLKALGFNLLGYEGSPYGEGVVYDANGNVLGIKEDYLNNVRRLLNICREVGMPVLWSVCFHTTSATDYYEDGKLAWDIIAQAYANPDVADQYAEKFVKPLCEVLAEYPDVVVMVSSGVELENEINDSAIGNYFDGGRLLYGVNQDAMLYFLKAITDTVKAELPGVAVTNSGTSSDLSIYEDIDFDYVGKNQYTINANASDIEGLRASAPVIATEFGFGEGVTMEDEVWTIKQIRFRDNFMAEGYTGWMYWCWSNTGYGGVFDLLAPGGLSTTDFRAGAFAIKYNADYYRGVHREGEDFEIVLDTPVMFCNKGSGTIEWISSRQATALSLLRSVDGGKTWTTVLDKVAPTDYEKNFKGTYVDEEIANHKKDGTKVMYKVIVSDDDGNTRESEPSNNADIIGPPINILEEQGLNFSFEDGLKDWIEFGNNADTLDEANYSAKVIEVDDVPHGNKVLEFKLNYRIEEDGSVTLGSDWSGIHMDSFDVKPNTTYKLVLKYKIAPDAMFEYEESDNTNKMSGYLFVRHHDPDNPKEDKRGNGLGDLYDASPFSTYLLRGSKNEWREDTITFKTNTSTKMGLDFRAVSYVGVPIHYYIDYIQLYEVL